MSIPPDRFCNDWNPQEFYHLVRFLAWESHGKNEYEKLIALKHKVS